jgi:hypothetical protein
VITTSSRGASRASGNRSSVAGGRRLIRQASAWLPSQLPRPARLQDLEGSDAIRWVDLYGGGLHDSETQALLDPVCSHELTPRMVRDLITPARYPAERRYDGGGITIAAAFRTRHLRGEGGHLTSLFEPVHLLCGDNWLLTCWLPPRAYRGLDGVPEGYGGGSSELYAAVARMWPGSDGETGFDLAALARGELSAAYGYEATAG